MIVQCFPNRHNQKEKGSIESRYLSPNAFIIWNIICISNWWECLMPAKRQALILRILLRSFCSDIMRYFPRLYYYLTLQNVMLYEKKLQKSFYLHSARWMQTDFHCDFSSALSLFSVFGLHWMWIMGSGLQHVGWEPRLLDQLPWPRANNFLLSRMELTVRPTWRCYS